MASSSSQPLSRGAACLPCRKLKARCDGIKPACGRCIANSRPDDCEYAVGGEVTRSRLLEENIALLEARIRELENPSESPSVRLHNPRQRSGTTAGTTRDSASEPVEMHLSFPEPLQPIGECLLRHYDLTGFSPRTYLYPSPQEIQLLVQTFMAHACQLGFFLNPTRLMQAVNLPRGAPGPVSEAFLNAVYLWGSRLSRQDNLRAREAYFAAKAVQTAASTTFLAQSMSPDCGVLHTIQTEVLLALYFMSSGRNLEGKYHGVAAIALAMGSKLHQLDAVGLASTGADPVSIGEKVRAFWTVFAMDKAWATALNTAPSICQHGRARVTITTPWPLAVEAYEQGSVVARRGLNYSIDEYVQGEVDESSDEFSSLALRAKAAALCDSALHLSWTYRPDMPNRAEYLARFSALDSLIERFHRRLAAIRNGTPDDLRELLVCRTYACVAAIQLHSAFASNQPASRQKTVNVALAAARALDLTDFNQHRHLDPVIAEFWSTICKVLIEEMRRVTTSASAARQDDIVRITSSLDRIMGAMAALAPSSPLIGAQALIAS
ncbi:hypothetical protein BD414DRAFT_427596 [Trametes punicea]|nr:hypothetical protein BD414DRAFT_427596 [Trametes punicea]